LQFLFIWPIFLYLLQVNYTKNHYATFTLPIRSTPYLDEVKITTKMPNKTEKQQLVKQLELKNKTFTFVCNTNW